jgi:hypothetical protein
MLGNFYEHTKEVIWPAFEKYTKLYDNDMYESKRAMNACTMFDPFILEEASIVYLELLVDDLQYFGQGYPERVDSRCLKRPWLFVQGAKQARVILLFPGLCDPRPCEVSPDSP